MHPAMRQAKKLASLLTVCKEECGFPSVRTSSCDDAIADFKPNRRQECPLDRGSGPRGLCLRTAEWVESTHSPKSAGGDRRCGSQMTGPPAISGHSSLNGRNSAKGKSGTRIGRPIFQAGAIGEFASLSTRNSGRLAGLQGYCRSGVFQSVKSTAI